MLGSHNNSTILIISNDEMKDIKIIKSLEDLGLLFKGVSETIQNEAKELKGGFLSMLLGILGTSLLGNILAGKGTITKRQGWRINRAEEGVIRAGFLSMLLGILDVSLLGNILAGKGAITKRQGRGINRAGEGVIRAGYGTKRQH